MSLSTAANRRAAAAIALPFLLPGVVPDGSMAKHSDRVAPAWSYNFAFIDPIAFDADRTTIRFVCRLPEAESVVLQADTSDAFPDPFESAAVVADADTGFTAKGSVTGLSPNTTYYHRFLVGGTLRTYVTAPTGGGTDPAYITTAPADETTDTIKIAVGSCTLDGNGTVWQAIDSQSPDLFLHLGDRAYIDDLIQNPPDALADYVSGYGLVHRNYSDAEGRFTRYLPLRRACKFVMDDHDHGLGDIDVASTNFAALRAWALEAYSAFTPHPSFVRSDAIFRKERWGPVELFMLDTRFAKQDVGTYDRFPSSGTDTHVISVTSTRSSIVVVDGGAGHATDKTADAYKGWYVRLSQAHYDRTVVRPPHSDMWRRVLSSAQSAADAVTLTLEESLPTWFDPAVDKYLFMEEASILDGSGTPFGTGNQWEWLVDELRASTARVKLVVSTMPVNNTHVSDDNWRKYSALNSEIRTLYQMTSDVRNIFVVSGDTHRHEADDGTNSEWPDACSSPLDAAGSTGAAATWSHGQATRPTDNPDGTSNGHLLITVTTSTISFAYYWTNSGSPTAMGGMTVMGFALDDRDDLDVLARTDGDSATIRPVRVTTAHAADGERQADVVGYDRSHRLDRHYVLSSRSHRTPNVGCRFAVEFTGARAGETFALDRMVAWLSATEQRQRAADTTARADVDGATAAVPTWLSRVSSDAQRQADFATVGGTTQDRWIARHPVATAQGLGKVFHVEIETDGRAGACFALDRLVAWVSDAAMARPGDET